jgi:hypothetical protein
MLFISKCCVCGKTMSTTYTDKDGADKVSHGLCCKNYKEVQIMRFDDQIGCNVLDVAFLKWRMLYYRCALVEQYITIDIRPIRATEYTWDDETGHYIKTPLYIEGDSGSAKMQYIKAYAKEHGIIIHLKGESS